MSCIDIGRSHEIWIFHGQQAKTYSTLTLVRRSDGIDGSTLRLNDAAICIRQCEIRRKLQAFQL